MNPSLVNFGRGPNRPDHELKDERNWAAAPEPKDPGPPSLWQKQAAPGLDKSVIVRYTGGINYSWLSQPQ